MKGAPRARSMPEVLGPLGRSTGMATIWGPTPIRASARKSCATSFPGGDHGGDPVHGRFDHRDLAGARAPGQRRPTSAVVVILQRAPLLGIPAGRLRKR